MNNDEYGHDEQKGTRDGFWFWLFMALWLWSWQPSFPW